MNFESQRRQMVEQQLDRRGIRDPRLLKAFGRVPRELFVPKALEAHAYDDRPLPIGEGQTISQPYIVALMLSLMELRENERVLEIGTGSGYQTALLAELTETVFTVERIASLAEAARMRIESLRYCNVQMRCGNGAEGWGEHAPYAGVIVSAGVPNLPEPLLGQVGKGGRLIAPVGPLRQQVLIRCIRQEDNRFAAREFGGCAFVPLIGEHGWPESQRGTDGI